MLIGWQGLNSSSQTPQKDLGNTRLSPDFGNTRLSPDFT